MRTGAYQQHCRRILPSEKLLGKGRLCCGSPGCDRTGVKGCEWRAGLCIKKNIDSLERRQGELFVVGGEGDLLNSQKFPSLPRGHNEQCRFSLTLPAVVTQTGTRSDRSFGFSLLIGL